MKPIKLLAVVAIVAGCERDAPTPPKPKAEIAKPAVSIQPRLLPTERPAPGNVAVRPSPHSETRRPAPGNVGSRR